MYTSSILSGMNKMFFPYMPSSLFHWHPKTYSVTVHSFWILTVTWTLGCEDKLWFIRLSEINFIFLVFINLENKRVVGHHCLDPSPDDCLSLLGTDHKNPSSILHPVS